MVQNKRVKSPFATPETYSTSLGLCGAVKQFYKVKDAEAWYVENRKMLLDKVLPDPFGFTNFENIHEWHRYQILKLVYIE